MVASAVRIGAQADTSVTLPELEISDSPIFATEDLTHTDQWHDSVLIEPVHSELGEFLALNSSVFIKSYGAGGVATATIRGSNAGQVAVLWNGIPIQNAMLGLSDLSLIPSTFFNEISLEKGGNSAVHGSGAVGGTIGLSSSIRQDSGYTVRATAESGSFGRQSYSADAAFRIGKVTSRTRFNHASADNDFTYIIRPDLPERTQSNAAVRQTGFIQDLRFELGNQHTLSAAYWWQEADRQIPPNVNQTTSEARQYDRSHRVNVAWNFRGRQDHIEVKTGYFNEVLNFEDPRSGIDSRSSIETWFADGTYQRYLSDGLQFTAGVQQLLITAFTDAYREDRQQSRTSVKTGLSYTRQSWMLDATVRQEYYDGTFAPFAFAVSAGKRTTSGLFPRIRISRDYRLPGLNDIHWRPGGNPDLTPENGLTFEAGLDYTLQTSAHDITSKVSAYTRMVDDWILWSPEEGVPYWSAHNLSKVWSRGVDAEVNWRTSYYQWSFSASAAYGLAKSTNEVEIETPALDEGEQLIYTPVHNGVLSAGVGWRDYRATYTHTFTGEVRTEADTTIPQYDLGNIKLSGKIRLGSVTGDLQFRINNIWNTNYEVLLNRPMPGVNYNLGISITIDK